MDTLKAAALSCWNAVSLSTAPKPLAFAVTIPGTGCSSALSRQHYTNNRSKLATAATASSAVAQRQSIKCGAVAGEGIITVDEGQFSDVVLKSERLVLVEFVADWCGPCRLISPAIQWVAQEYKEKLSVVKIDHEANPNLIKEYQVYGLPTLIVFKSGKEVPQSRKEGAITKSKLKDHLDAILDSTVA